MGTYIEDNADLPLVALCRRTDPPTSRSAAIRSRSVSSGHRAAIVEALAAGPAGQTEIARRAGLTVAAVSKRLHELRKSGAIERTGREVEGGESEYRNTPRQSR